jgi:hypothetical protein
MLLVFVPDLRAQDDAVNKSQRAKQAMVDRRFDEAVRLYSELSRAMPQNAGMRFNLAIALHSAGRYRGSGYDLAGSFLKVGFSSIGSIM